MPSACGARSGRCALALTLLHALDEGDVTNTHQGLAQELAVRPTIDLEARVRFRVTLGLGLGCRSWPSGPRSTRTNF